MARVLHRSQVGHAQNDANDTPDETATAGHMESKPLVHEHVRSISSSQEDGDPASSEKSRPLQHFNLIFYTSIVYALAAVFAWIIICILAYRPITTQTYALVLANGDAKGLNYPSSSIYTQNEQWYQAARVIQSILAVVTIPLASAVCSGAAVVFVQRSCSGDKLSLRQTVALADRGWTDFEVHKQLLRGRWKQYGSRLLYIAIVLNLLGAVLLPLQSVFLYTTTKQAPSHMTQVGNLSDLSASQHLLSDDLAHIYLRGKLVTTQSKDPQSRLWSAEGATKCVADGDGSIYAPCAFGQLSLANMSAINDPFLAQLPAGYNTGLVRQYLPRVNSSTSRRNITEVDFPEGCSQSPTFFSSFVEPHATDGLPWHATACMLDAPSRPILNSSRQRLDMSETLFLNLSAGGGARSQYYQITVNTTTGYFELPNNMNKGLPGPLLEGDPSALCGRDCIMQGLIAGQSIYDHANYDPNVVDLRIPPAQRATAESTSDPALLNSTYSGVFIPQKGPLLTTALALFGPGSYLADRAKSDTGVDECVDRPPLKDLLTDLVGERDSTDSFRACVNGSRPTYAEIQKDAGDYIKMFYLNGVMIVTLNVTYDSVVTNAFAAAAFLANEQWLTSGLEKPMIVSQDAGVSIQLPAISFIGIIIISLWLLVFLSALLALAFYGKMHSRWTERLDALTMMQLGSALANDLPFALIGNNRDVTVLDKTPGWVGDARRGEGDVGKLSLGQGTALQPARRYTSFEHEVEQSKAQIR